MDHSLFIKTDQILQLARSVWPGLCVDTNTVGEFDKPAYDRLVQFNPGFGNVFEGL
jgi:hypothetical protein